MRGTTMALTALLVATGSVQAGASGPAFEGPDEQDRFVEQRDGTPLGQPWWEGFHDDELTRMIDEGLLANGDVQAAFMRVEQAQAAAQLSLVPILPSVSFDVSESTAPYDSLGFQMGGIPSAPGEDDPPEVYHTGSAMLSGRIPLTIWGGSIPSYRAGRLDAAASEGDGEAQALRLAGSIARAYFDVVAAREQLQLIQVQIETNRALLEITELRYLTSEATGLDVLQQRQQLAATEALVPQARSLARTRQQQLTVLLGRQVDQEATVTRAELPQLPVDPDSGVPLDLLANRPDLRASGRRLEAAGARKNASIQSFLPGLSLSGQVGTQAMYVEELETQETWGVGATLSIPLFQGTTNWANFVQARSATRSATATHEQAIRQAVQEVEGALVREEETRAQLEAYTRLLEASRLAFTEAQQRYAAGLTSYLTVLTAINSQQQAELNVLSAHRDLIDARITVHESLGGPWTTGLSTGGR